MSNKRFAPKLKIKKGDQVKVIAGSSKGSQGEVLVVFPAENRAIVKDAQMVKKHVKSTQEEPGGILEKEATIHISNLALIDPKTGKTTRVGRKEVDGKLQRYSKKTGEIIK